LRYRAQIALMLAPYLIGILIFTIIPALVGVPLAFTAYNALEPPVFNGLDNFAELLRDDVFHKAVVNSLIFVGLATPLRLAGALGLALLLLRRGRGIPIYRAAVYLPTVVPDGLFGIPGPPWMIEETSARIGIVILLSWQIGEGLVVCLAALQDVPRELYEQAAVDGGPSGA
jgi:multiple sugar transport system permease protein